LNGILALWSEVAIYFTSPATSLVLFGPVRFHDGDRGPDFKDGDKTDNGEGLNTQKDGDWSVIKGNVECLAHQVYFVRVGRDEKDKAKPKPSNLATRSKKICRK
jgi:hypothetical protein